MKGMLKAGLFVLILMLITSLSFAQEDKILIGSSSALTGHARFLGSEYLKGAKAFINKINEQGGINAKKIEIISLDDGYDPKRCAENTVKLITEDKVFVLFNYVGTPTTVYALPVITSRKVPLLGVFSGAMSLREPFNPYLINIRTSYQREIGEFLKHCLEGLRLKKIAVFYQYDAFGMDGLKATEEFLSQNNLKIVEQANYKRGTLDVEEAVSAIKKSGAEVVVMIGTYNPIAQFIKLCRKENFKPLFYSVSFVGTEALLQELGPDAHDVVISQVVPLPQGDKFPAIMEFKELLSKYYPESQPTQGSFEGFINAKVLVEALKRCTGLDRESFIKAVESIKDFDAGIGANINFGPGDHQALDKVYFSLFSNGKLMPLEDWQGLAATIKKD